MSEDEFNAAVNATRRGVAECMREYAAPKETPIDRLVRIAVEQESITGLAAAYGEQCADTDGTAAVDAAWDEPYPRRQSAKYLVSDGHEDDAKPSGCAHQWGADERWMRLTARMRR